MDKADFKDLKFEQIKEQINIIDEVNAINQSQTQLAIQELEKVKVNLRTKLYLLESGYLRHFVAWHDICDQINGQIKELKG